jgi:hypothetical protein
MSPLRGWTNLSYNFYNNVTPSGLGIRIFVSSMNNVILPIGRQALGIKMIPMYEVRRTDIIVENFRLDLSEPRRGEIIIAFTEITPRRICQCAGG